jgi:hypothetical protein
MSETRTLQEKEPEIKITPELRQALMEFMGEGKPAGSVTVTFRNGGIAGVESSRRWK